MKTLLRGGTVWTDGALKRADVLVTDGTVTRVGENLQETADRLLDVSGLVVFPGFADVHVHFREPGFSYKETIATGSRAAARGGYTAVCAMPNLNPVPDTPEHLEQELDIIRRDAVIDVLPFASITMGRKGSGQVVDVPALAPKVCGFSDDGTGVWDENAMRHCMEACRDAGSIISAHCEDLTLIPRGGAVHESEWSRQRGIPGIPSESEWGPIARDLQLAGETGCAYHVCHISCKESVELIRKAKAEGVNVTCETGPHYLLLCQEDLKDEGRFKMNPPVRSADDRDALLEGLLDGTVDCIATDHAPHSAEEKSRGLRNSAMGVVGIEAAFPLLYTYLVETGKVPLETVIRALTENPRRRFNLPGGLREGDRAALCAWDLNVRETVDPEQFLSMGKATPFAGWEVHAACRLTLLEDNIVYGGTDR